MDPFYARHVERFVEKSKRRRKREAEHAARKSMKDSASVKQGETDKPIEGSTTHEDKEVVDPSHAACRSPVDKRPKWGERAIAVSTSASRLAFSLATEPRLTQAPLPTKDSQTDFEHSLYLHTLHSEALGAAASLLLHGTTPTKASAHLFSLPTTPASKHGSRIQSFNALSVSNELFPNTISTDLCLVSPSRRVSISNTTPRARVTPVKSKNESLLQFAQSPSRRVLFPNAATPRASAASNLNPSASASAMSPSPSATGSRPTSTPYISHLPTNTNPTTITHSPSTIIPPYTPPHPNPSTTNYTQYIESTLHLNPFPFTTHLLALAARSRPRSIAKSPYKVLDAPELQDDFYLNLVDWSSLNCLGVGLGSCVYLWDASSSRVTKLCDLSVPGMVAGQTPQGDTVTSVSWNPTGTLIAIGTNKGLLQIYDAPTSTHLHTLSGHESRIGSLAWTSPTQLTTGSRDRYICLRDLNAGGSHATGITDRLQAHRQEVCGLKWAQHPTPDKYLASGGNDNKLLLWDRTMLHTPLHTFKDHQAAVKAIAWSPHRNGLLASGGGTADQHIRFWNTRVGEALGGLNTQSQVCNLAWSLEADEVVSTHGFSQNQVVVWKVSNGVDGKTPQLSSLATLTGHTMRVLYLAVSPDNQNIVTGAGDETLRFWSVFGKSQRKEVTEVGNELMVR
ncbi:hypothetical protein HDU98_009238 [Podochytrium sp. JEL0797]|nr:hypothetical protein HDU98_009238 [Podochytrium sp. JEL0797]